MSNTAPDYSVPSSAGVGYLPPRRLVRAGLAPAKGGDARTPRGKALVECDGWDFLPVVLWKISSEGVILRANLASDELLGYEPLEFLGRKLDDFLVDSIDFKSFSKRIGLIPKATSVQVCLRCKDGSTRDVAIDANRVADGSGGEVIHCAVADQSVQRRTEGFAREQAEFFTKSTEALLIQDPSGSITFWSQGAERLYGVASKDAIGRHMLDLPAFDKTQAAAARKAVLANGEWSGAMRNFTASGNEIAVESRWVLLRDREGRSQSIVVINDDAADAKVMEEDRLRAQRQECIGTLAGGIAHDLNNILQPISIALDLFRSRLSDDESQEMLQLVDSNVRRATELVRQILTFTSGVRGDRKSMAVAPLFGEVANFIRQTFPKSIQLQLAIDEQAGAILGDSTQIEQVLLNLCVNARDAMSDGGCLRLEASNFEVEEGFSNAQQHAKPGRYVRLTVSDTGSGIPRQLRKKIFEPFFTTKGPEKGTGLGLAAALGIIRSHNGFLTLETEEGCGSSFHAFIPAARAVGPTPPPVSSSASIGDLKGGGEAILLVDDELTVLKVMQRSLEKSGYRVLTAADGEAGLDVYFKHREEIRLVITDMAMPGMDGLDMIAALKKANPMVKVICTSGLNTPSNLGLLDGLGVQAILSKPCNSRTILQAIKEALGTSPQTPA